MLKLVGTGRRSSQVRQSRRETLTQERTNLYFVYTTMHHAVPGGLNDKYVSVCFITGALSFIHSFIQFD